MKTKRVEPEIVTRDGKPVSVIVPIEVYQEMLERIEDAEDLEKLKEIRSRPQSFRKMDEVFAELGV